MRALVIGLLLAGCAKDVTKEFEQLAERACACADQKDTACGKAVLGDMVKLVKESRNVTGDEPRTAAAAKRLGECLLRSGVKSVEISNAINALNAKDEPAEAAGAEAELEQPRGQPNGQPNEQPNDQPNERPNEQPKDLPKDQPKDQPKE
jgi:hypothetical protein